MSNFSKEEFLGMSRGMEDMVRDVKDAVIFASWALLTDDREPIMQVMSDVQAIRKIAKGVIDDSSLAMDGRWAPRKGDL